MGFTGARKSDVMRLLLNQKLPAIVWDGKITGRFQSNTMFVFGVGQNVDGQVLVMHDHVRHSFRGRALEVDSLRRVLCGCTNHACLMPCGITPADIKAEDAPQSFCEYLWGIGYGLGQPLKILNSYENKRDDSMYNVASGYSE